MYIYIYIIYITLLHCIYIIFFREPDTFIALIGIVKLNFCNFDAPKVKEYYLHQMKIVFPGFAVLSY